MKICKKCKREFKDDYIYCPQCGKPYDDSVKPVKTPGNIGESTSSTLFKIWNIILYIFGGFMILGSILTIVDDSVTSIVGILFGLSLFQIIYKLIEEKTMIDEKFLKIARIVLPIVLIIVLGIVAPSEPQTASKNTTNNTAENISDTESVQNNDKNNSAIKKGSQEQKTKTTEKDANKNEYMDALRKCSVMEAADIYTTGVGKKSDNAFNDGRETCESWYKQWGEKDFFAAVNEDWKNRQNEEIDGKPLSYYLDILGW